MITNIKIVASGILLIYLMYIGFKDYNKNSKVMIKKQERRDGKKYPIQDININAPYELLVPSQIEVDGEIFDTIEAVMEDPTENQKGVKAVDYSLQNIIKIGAVNKLNHVMLFNENPNIDNQMKNLTDKLIEIDINENIKNE